MGIERPQHYNPGSTYEPIRIIEAYDLNFNLGNVIKYVLRPTKGQYIEDLQKARQYINFEIERIVNNSRED